jgi:uncharacterized damage-inducible protein DinB
LENFRILARYNRLANDRLYATCAELTDNEYRRQQRGPFGSIHALLNHILLADRIWMSRFDGQGQTTPPLDSVLHEHFSQLRAARVAQDTAIEAFFAGTGEEFLTQNLSCSNSKGRIYVDRAEIAAMPRLRPASRPISPCRMRPGCCQHADTHGEQRCDSCFTGDSIHHDFPSAPQGRETTVSKRVHALYLTWRLQFRDWVENKVDTATARVSKSRFLSKLSQHVDVLTVTAITTSTEGIDRLYSSR